MSIVGIVTKAARKTADDAQRLAGESFDSTSFGKSFSDVNSDGSKAFRNNLVDGLKEDLDDISSLTSKQEALLRKEMTRGLNKTQPDLSTREVRNIVNNQLDEVTEQLADPSYGKPLEVRQEPKIGDTDNIELETIRVAADTPTNAETIKSTRKISDILSGNRIDGDARAVLDTLEDQLRRSDLISTDSPKTVKDMVHRKATPERIIEKIMNKEPISENEFTRLNNATMNKNTEIINTQRTGNTAGTIPPVANTVKSEGMMSGIGSLISKPFQAMGGIVKVIALTTATAAGGTWLLSSSEDREMVEARNKLEQQMQVSGINASKDPYTQCAVDGVVSSYSKALQESHVASGKSLGNRMSEHMSEEFKDCAAEYSAYNDKGEIIPPFSKNEEQVISNAVTTVTNQL